MRNGEGAGVVLLPGDEVRVLHHMEVDGRDLILTMWGGRVIRVLNVPDGLRVSAKEAHDRGDISRIDLRGTPWL